MLDIIFLVLELVGTVSFAVSGATVAISKKTDLFGVVFLGSVTAVGGGVMRDILLGLFPPRAFTNALYVSVAVIVSIIVFVLARIFKEKYTMHERVFESVNNVFDALGLGIFTVTGINAALSSDTPSNAFFAIFLGVTTGVGGGILRDLLSASVPSVLKKHIYAVASIAGGCVYYLLVANGVYSTVAAVICVAIVFIIRILATVFKWNLPKA